MGLVSIELLSGTAAILIGLLLIVGSLYPQRGGRLRHRQGAKVLLGFGLIVGLAVLTIGGLWALKTLTAAVLIDASAYTVIFGRR